MEVTQIDGRFALKVEWSEIVDAIGGLADKDFRDGIDHLADVAAQNNDAPGLDLLLLAVKGQDTPQGRSVMCLLTEAMAVGKEITLRKLARVFDPHGEFIDMPADWIGKGPGA